MQYRLQGEDRLGYNGMARYFTRYYYSRINNSNSMEQDDESKSSRYCFRNQRDTQEHKSRR